ncbi:LLM class flavin-dependent oxidoreductase [Mycobacterium sp. MMS18-G62]
METLLRFDMRGPSFGPPLAHLYAAALEMAAYADERGVDAVVVSEHHGSDDGYCPAPTVLAGGLAARTKRTRIRLGVVLLPLHNPIAVAEQTLVLDQMSDGRAELVIGAGYVPSEFAMFGRRLGHRSRLLDDGLPQLAAALAGQEVTVGDHTFVVTPTAVQRPRPPLYVGGGVAAAARRAARYADGFAPMVPNLELYDAYRAECRSLGHEPGRIVAAPSTLFVHVAEDPGKAWETIGKHALHELNSYGRWAMESTTGTLNSPFAPVADVAAARASGLYKVVTVDDCVALMNEFDSLGQPVVLTPLMGGLDPEAGWASLQLYFEQVLPAYRAQSHSVATASNARTVVDQVSRQSAKNG